MDIATTATLVAFSAGLMMFFFGLIALLDDGKIILFCPLRIMTLSPKERIVMISTGAPLLLVSIAKMSL